MAQIADQTQTRYFRSGTVSVAYQVVGDGPRDLVYSGGCVRQERLVPAGLEVFNQLLISVEGP